MAYIVKISSIFKALGWGKIGLRGGGGGRSCPFPGPPPPLGGSNDPPPPAQANFPHALERQGTVGGGWQKRSREVTVGYNFGELDIWRKEEERLCRTGRGGREPLPCNASLGRGVHIGPAAEWARSLQVAVAQGQQ